MARTRIEDSTAANRCTLTSPDGEVTYYWAPMDGGYVRDVTRQPGTLGPQVCDRLAYTGNTLHWNGKGRLIDIIRREHRARKRREHA